MFFWIGCYKRKVTGTWFRKLVVYSWSDLLIEIRNHCVVYVDDLWPSRKWGLRLRPKIGGGLKGNNFFYVYFSPGSCELHDCLRGSASDTPTGLVTKRQQAASSLLPFQCSLLSFTQREQTTKQLKKLEVEPFFKFQP